MIPWRCKDCDWWDTEHWKLTHIKKPYLSDEGVWGFCRRRVSGAIGIDNYHWTMWAISDQDDFCKEFKKAEGE